MKPILGAILFLVSLGAASADQNDDYSAGVMPPHLSTWPKSLQNYQELPGSRSPDGQYGFIYPKRDVAEELSDARLYLARLRPFQQMASLPLHDGNLCENSGSSYSVQWTRDSSAAVFYVGGKKGPFNIFVVSINNGHFASLTDLENPIRKLVQASYDHSHAPRFNGDFDFIFTDGDDIKDANGQPLDIESSWTPNEAHQVLVKCICTNDPKHLEPVLWEVVFEGTWDIGRSTFIQHQLERIPQNRLPPF